MYSAHFRDYNEKIQSDPAVAQPEHSITASSPREDTRKAKPLQRQVDETLLTRYVGIVTRKNDRDRPLADVQDPRS